MAYIVQKPFQKVYLSTVHTPHHWKKRLFQVPFDMQGLICIPSALFSSDGVAKDKGKMKKLGQLGICPLQNNAKVFDKLAAHLSNKYHTIAQCRDLECVRISGTNSCDVWKLVDKNVRVQAQENRDSAINYKNH